jgi:CheY-like chemotaxis protein
VNPSRILVVDDEWKIRQIVVHLLGQAGYETADTGDPTEVARLAEEFKPDLVILDISMPQKDGLDVARELRSAEATSKIPIMFMTARDEAGLVDRAHELGASGYVEKPFSNETYLKVVSRVLQGVR